MAGTAAPQKDRQVTGTATAQGQPDYAQQAQQMATQLVSAPPGARDVGPDVSGAPGTFPTIDPTDPELQKGLFDTLFHVVGPAVLAALDAFTGQQRAAGVAVSADPDQHVRDLVSILTDLGPKLWGLVPDVISALAQTASTGNRDVPSPEDDEAQQRFLIPLLTGLLPVVIPAVTDLINNLFKQRDVSPNGPAAPTLSVVRGETGAVVGRDLFGTLFSGIVQSLPGIIQLLTGQSRDIGLNWNNFGSGRTYDGDDIILTESDLGDPNVIEFTLNQPYNTWWKGIEVMVGDSVIQSMSVQDNKHSDGPYRVPASQLRGAGHLRISKAKFLGIHTNMYEVYGLDQKAGKSLVFDWLDD
jgi:hypothetical protein